VQERASNDWSGADRGRREPGFGEPPRAPVRPDHPDDRDGLDFLRQPERDDYPVAPQHGADEPDYDHRGGRGVQAYGRDGHPDDAFADGEFAEPDEYDDEEDEDERGGKRRSMGVVMAVVGLAVFGGVAAFGYHTMFNAAPSGPTPIIHADNSPTKMTPINDTKPENGRTGYPASEKLRPPAEDPVDPNVYHPANANDAVGQFPQDAAGGYAPNIMPNTPGAVAPPADTKRVQTVAINADAGTAGRNAQSRSVGASPPPQPSPPRAAAPSSPPPQRQAALTPDTGPTASTAAPVESGGYVVQLSAVRSETDAQTAFRQLQAKYPVLSGRQPLIRRKDQGERGIFFAAQVGPFGTKSDADQLCEQLKSAGGSCFVQRN
jgi:cell division septation protein DedD